MSAGGVARGAWRVGRGATTNYANEPIESDRDLLKSTLYHYRHLVERIERTGLRLFHKEVNVDHQDDTVELAFIQATWRPGRKAYTAEAVEAAADASISSHGASQKVLTY